MAANGIRLSREERWRIFCAIDLPSHARLRVMAHIASLRKSLPEIRAGWSRETSLHLTLKFLGEIPRESVTTFSEALSRAVKEFAEFPIVLEHTGIFPKRRDPRVLWIGISDPARKLSELHSRIEDESARVGFPNEARPFHPHLTLARLRDQRHAREIVEAHEQLEFTPIEINVFEVLVIRSELTSAGSKYTVNSRHGLIA